MTTHPLYTTTRSLSIASKHPRTLLLTFDAFGTLFYPHPPVPSQYATIAHEFGLPRTAVTPERIKTAFKDTFRAHIKQFPNYGRADVLRGRYGGPRQWWEEVIRGCFARVLETNSKQGCSDQQSQTQAGVDADTRLPDGMVEVLVNRFAGADGYTLYEDVTPFFARMGAIRSSRHTRRTFDRILLGVISNSDDRVPSVLKALGLRVGDLRADQDLSSTELPGFEERRSPQNQSHSQNFNGKEGNDHIDTDLDLIITSYEAGEEKPNRLIFDVARRQAQLLAREETHTHGSTPVGVDDPDEWVCVHVGDDYEKDYRAAMDAGWRGYLLSRGEEQERSAETISSLMDLVDKLRLDP